MYLCDTSKFFPAFFSFSVMNKWRETEKRRTFFVFVSIKNVPICGDEKYSTRWWWWAI